MIGRCGSKKCKRTAETAEVVGFIFLCGFFAVKNCFVAVVLRSGVSRTLVLGELCALYVESSLTGFTGADTAYFDKVHLLSLLCSIFSNPNHIFYLGDNACRNGDTHQNL